MCIDTVSLPNVSRYGDISIYCCISSTYTVTIVKWAWNLRRIIYYLPDMYAQGPRAYIYQVNHKCTVKFLTLVVHGQTSP